MLIFFKGTTLNFQQILLGLIIIVAFTLETTNMPFNFRNLQNNNLITISYFNATNHGSSTLNFFEKLKRNTISNTSFEDGRLVHKTVLSIPSIISSSKAKYSIRGSDLILPCMAHPSFDSTLQNDFHYFWSNQLGDAIVARDRYHMFRNGSLFMHNIQPEDNGWYSCRIRHIDAFETVIVGETFHRRVIVYSAPVFGYLLEWGYRITNCIQNTELAFKDWIYGELAKDACNDLPCELNEVTVKCQTKKFPPYELKISMYMSSTIMSSPQCDIACVEIMEAEAVTKALKNLKTKLKNNQRIVLPNSDGILLFLTSTFSSHFKMSCMIGYEMKFNVCITCDAGTFSTVSSPVCEPCDLGFFANKSGSSACQPCPMGTTTVEPGAKSVNQCQGIYLKPYLPYILTSIGCLLTGIVGGLLLGRTCLRKRDSESEIEDDEEENEDEEKEEVNMDSQSSEVYDDGSEDRSYDTDASLLSEEEWTDVLDDNKTGMVPSEDEEGSEDILEESAKPASVGNFSSAEMLDEGVSASDDNKKGSSPSESSIGSGSGTSGHTNSSGNIAGNEPIAADESQSQTDTEPAPIIIRPLVPLSSASSSSGSPSENATISRPSVINAQTREKKTKMRMKPLIKAINAVAAVKEKKTQRLLDSDILDME